MVEKLAFNSPIGMVSIIFSLPLFMDIDNFLSSCQEIYYPSSAGFIPPKDLPFGQKKPMFFIG
jgi:hypothetical protein